MSAPGPTAKVWYIDPVNGKTPADGGNGSQTAPWNSLTGVLSFKFPPGYTRPLLSSVPYYHVVEGKRVYVADQLGSPPVHPGDTIELDGRRLRRHRHRRLLATGRQPRVSSPSRPRPDRLRYS